MVRKGWKSLEMAGKAELAENGSKWVKIARMAGNGWKLL